MCWLRSQDILEFLAKGQSAQWGFLWSHTSLISSSCYSRINILVRLTAAASHVKLSQLSISTFPCQETWKTQQPRLGIKLSRLLGSTCRAKSWLLFRGGDQQLRSKSLKTLPQYTVLAPWITRFHSRGKTISYLKYYTLQSFEFSITNSR